MKKYLVAAVLIGAFAITRFSRGDWGREVLRGPRHHYQKMLGRDRDGLGHENDGRV